ncbi:MAG: tripartite tricarboxylate transporter substrate binding protein [Desulfitobacteriaceae bacterium]
MLKSQIRTSVFVSLLTLTLVLSGCGSSGSSASTAKKEDIKYPVKPITLLVWSAAGSPVDIMARQVAKVGEKYLGQPIVVDNKTGGDGAVAMQAMLASPAEGYTMTANTRSMVTSLATTLKDSLKPDQFIYVYKLQDDPYLLAVRDQSPFKTLDDLIKQAKEKPGSISISGYGSDSAQALVGADWAKQAAIQTKWVPYDGGSKAVVAALGGNTDAVLTNLSGVVNQIKAKQLRILAISTDKRSDLLPDTPTFKELGYKDLVQSHWRGIMVKVGTPDAVVQKLYNALDKVASDPDFVSYMKTGGLITPEKKFYKEFSAEVQADVKKMEEALKNK